MILVKFILIILGLFAFLLKSSELILRFQLKEYRFDRFLSYMRENGFWKELYSRRMLFPAKKLRNLALMGVVFVVSLVMSLFLYMLPFWALVIATALMPVFAFLLVSLLVFSTQIPVWIYREWVIRKAAKRIAGSKAVFIAVTGSYGKSSVKEMLYELLKTKFNVEKTNKNFNSDIGVAISVLKHLKTNTEYFIAEVGAYRIGETAKICSFIHPKIVVVTAFGNQHVDLYGSKQALVQAESEPLLFLDDEGTAYVNKDIPEFEHITKGMPFHLRTFGSLNKAVDVRATEIKPTAEGTKAEIHHDGSSFVIHTKLLGEHSITNFLPAIAVALDKGVSSKEIQKIINDVEPIEHKLSVHTGMKGSTVVSDSLNSNVDGFIEAIRVGELFKGTQHILVSKGVIELGSEKKESYKRIYDVLRESKFMLYTTDKMFAEVGSKEKVSLFDGEESILNKLHEQVGERSVVVLEGRFTEIFVKKMLAK